MVSALGLALLMLAVYFVLPEPKVDEPPWLTVAAVVVGGVFYASAGVWAFFRIHKSTHPARTGLNALVLMITAIVLIFALTYLALSVDNVDNFNEPLDKVSALYFTMTILTTTGFGDISAQSHAGMIAVMTQMVVSLTLLTTLARVLVEATRRATRRQRGQQT